ncbi:MAG: toxin-activating lysine-acyltransferase [Neisseria sp.]|nr:toxin-activating lysine-acyltransferase [Neisseria sp.]
MRFEDIDVIAPALFPDEPWNEAEALGAMTWLWLQSAHYRHHLVSEMAAWVLPVLKNGQFALFSRHARPLGYITWAYFDEAAEQRYLESNLSLLQNQDWQSGDRMWFVNWFAPLGHSREIKSIAARLFPNQCARSLHHRGNERGMKIMLFKGKNMSAAQLDSWDKAHPLMMPAPPKPD